MDKLNFNDGIRLRPSTPRDAPFIESLFRSTRQHILMADAERDYLETIVEHQFQLQSDSYEKNFPGAMVFIVEYNDKPIGRVVVDFGSNVAHLVDLMFIPQARGKGLGTSIVRALQQAAAKVGIPMTLVVDQGNRIAKRLYAKLGFVIESIKPPSELLVWYPTRS